jgi:glycosyltransferase involved in cell wall biosynthesis
MKILYLHRTQGVGVEGVHIRGMVDAARDAGHEVFIVGPEGTDPYAPPRPASKPSLASRFARHAPELVFEFAEMAYDKRLAVRLAEVVEGFKPDLIYERYAFFARAGSDLAYRLGVPHVIEVNYTCDDQLVRRRSKLLLGAAQRMEREIFGRAACLSPVSSRLVERLYERKVAEQRIAMTPNAVAGQWWHSAGEVEPVALPEAFPSHLPVTGFVGGFWPWHGVDRLVHAAARSRDAGQPTALLLVGDGPERENIEQLLDKLALRDLACLPGSVPHDQLAGWIAAMDICVMPHSNDYGSPMKVFEYMGLGKAVLAPDLPPLRDVIEHGTNGLLFDDSAEGLSDALQACVGDAEQRAMMGRVARERVGQLHLWEHNWARINSVLKTARAA